VRPRVTLHYAQSLDGRIARHGRTTRLSSPEGLVHAHRARASHDAVLVGAETVRVDDPLLTVRACEGPQPARVVLSTTLALPRTARFVTDRTGAGPRVVVGTREHARPEERAFLESQGVSIVLVGSEAPHRASLPEALAALAERGVRRLLVEGGGRVLTSLLAAGLADELSAEVAPVLLGDEGTPAVGALGGPAITLEEVRHEVDGGHVFVKGRVARGA